MSKGTLMDSEGKEKRWDSNCFESHLREQLKARSFFKPRIPFGMLVG